jgi:hypothetical protein
MLDILEDDIDVELFDDELEVDDDDEYRFYNDSKQS